MVASSASNEATSMKASIVPFDSRRGEPLPELPIPLTPIVGRETDLAAARAQLLEGNIRLLTITGPAGVGKTRFALELANAVKAAYPDGAVFVPLVTCKSEEAVLAALARGLAVRDEGDRSLEERLLGYLRPRSMLLVTDNFEQVVEAAPLVRRLLAACPNVTFLVTSSIALRVDGEHELPLQPLPLPETSDPAMSDAVRLFVQRARAVRPDFRLTAANAEVIADVCRRLDGLPLAIELAAARSNVLSPAELLSRLDQRFQVLVSQSRDVPERQQTMGNAIAWGYNLLQPDEQDLLRCLSVFAGGWTLEAAETVCNGQCRNVLDGLSALTDQSMVRQRELPDGSLRFSMLESIRDYAQAQLVSSGQADAARGAHLDYIEDLAHKAMVELTGRETGAWLERLDSDHDNIRVALEWVRSQRLGERGVALGAGFWRFWQTRGYTSEARRWMTVLDALPGAQVRTTVRAEFLFGMGRLLFQHGEYDLARSAFREAHAVALDVGEHPIAAGSLMQLGTVDTLQGDFDEARRNLDAGLAIRREHDDHWGTAMALLIRGRLSELNGELIEARELFDESLHLFREMQYQPGEARVMYHLGNLAMHEQRLDEALLHYQRSLATMREFGDIDGIGVGLLNMGLAHWMRGDLQQSQESVSEAIAVFQDLGTPAWTAACLEVFALLAEACDRHALSVQMSAVAAGLRAAKQTPIPPIHRNRHDQLLARLRRTLGNESYVFAWEQGRLMATDEAVALVRAGVTPAEGARKADQHAPDKPALTRREIEILGLVADGLSNQEIATRLYISPRTTTTHISNILRKLGVSSRTAAVAAARRQHLIG
jgi:predicted ATPase/DNA-binding CsgD family transcriptional regulator